MGIMVKILENVMDFLILVVNRFRSLVEIEM